MRKLAFSIILVASFAGAALSSEPARVTNLNVTQESDRSRIEIDLSQSVESSVRRVVGAPMIICELTGCLPNPGLASRAVDGRHVRSIRVFPQGDVTLVEITLGSPNLEYRYFNVRNTPRFVIDIMEPRIGSRGAVESASTRLPAPIPLGSLSEMTAASDSATVASKEAAAKKAKPDEAKAKTKKDSKAVPAKNSKARDAKAASKATPESEMAALLEKARKLIESGELAKGLSYLEVAASTLKASEEKTELFLLAARTGKSNGLCSQSARFYERLLKLDLPESLGVAVRVELGECLSQNGDADGATLMFDEALALAKSVEDSAFARRARAEWLLELDRPEDARDDLEVLALRGRDAMERAYAGYRLGVHLAGAGDTDAALAALEAIPADAPAGADSVGAYIVRAALVRRADILYRSERLDEARLLYERAAQSSFDPDTASWGLFQIANIERRSGRYAAAVARYEELALRWPESRWAKMARWGESEANWLLKEGGADKARVANSSGTKAG